MTTTQTPGAPPVEGAQWNGEQWFTFNTGTGNWEPVPPAAAPPVPPLPTPTGNGQSQSANGDGKKKERPAPIYADSLGAYMGQRPQQDFYPTWKFHKKPVGTWYEGIVMRNLTKYDSVAQTDGEDQPIIRNGQYLFQLQVPMLVMPNSDYPDGKATAIFKVGDARDKLNAAMTFANAPVTVDTLEDGTQVEGYVPLQGAYIYMEKIEDQDGTTREGKQFTRYIYRVEYRNADDSHAQEFAAKIAAAHRALADAGPPPQPPAQGALPAAYVQYAKDLEEYQAKLAGTATAAPAQATTPPAAPARPAVPAPAAKPPLPPPAPSAATQAAATHVATADAGLPPAQIATPAPRPPIPAPAAAAPAPASPTPAPAAAAPATNGAPVIVREQWLQMPPVTRKVVSEQTGVPIPDDLNPEHTSYAGQ